ncbi:MarR family winged helix-turn-helix transcriptional regulator [Rhodoligotrophos defluvii]|uniref:MarR family winged helix-turn-helix transcriptional regulator n=1 Tax=Rhodoligotrophos defluvii TaxID=2561934 RepID=UPI001EEFB27C|nr:MarR family transcriptional regulator [Rhodoligotrophos defluvii]
MRRRTDRALDRAGLGLTSGEARTLAYAAKFEGSRQTTLAELMGVEPMTLVGFLDKLEARALVQRVPDPDDRRAKLVHVTEAARPIVTRVAEIAAVTRASATDGLSPEVVDELRQILQLMRSNLMADEKEPKA